MKGGAIRVVGGSMGPAIALLLPLGLAGRQGPPPPLPSAQLSFPAYEERTLSNGARVIIVGRNEQPVATVNLVISGGTTTDPSGRLGTATMVASLLTQGTATRDALDIAESLDFVGAQLDVRNFPEWTVLSLAALTSDLEMGLELLADVVMNPAFPEDRIELARAQILTALRAELGSPGSIAARTLRRAVFGEHPYGRSETAETVRAIDREGLMAFHGERYRPGHALFVIAGDVEPDDIVARLESHFAGWERGSSETPLHPDPPSRAETEVILVHQPGSVQAAIRVGHTLDAAIAGDWTALSIANELLGGGSFGRLFQLLRREKGWTYGAYSGVARMRDMGVFEAGMEVRNQVVDSALIGLLGEIDRLKREMVSREELARITDHFAGSFPLRMETPQQVADEIANHRLLGLSKDDLENYGARVAALTPQVVRDAARAHLDPNRAVIVVVGDAMRLLGQVARFGPVTIEDIDGNRLSMEDFEVKASGLTFDASALKPGKWIYDIRSPEGVLGKIERRLVAGEEGRMTFSVLLEAPGQSGRQEVTFTIPDFHALTGSVRVTVQGRTMMATLRMDGDRLLGSIVQESVPTLTIQEVLPAGTMLGPMEELALWISELKTGETLRYPSVSMQEGRLANTTATVVGVGEVTVPAGTFEVYVVDLTGLLPAERIYVRVESPHILIKRESKGQPRTIELKSQSGG